MKVIITKIFTAHIYVIDLSTKVHAHLVLILLYHKRNCVIPITVNKKRKVSWLSV